LIGDGLVLTSLSAIAFRNGSGQLEPPAAIEVVTDQVGIVPARFVSGDPALDLAVLQLPDQLRELDGATLTPSDPTVGENMIAIGAEGNSLYVVGVDLERVEFASGGGARLYVNRALPPSFWGGPLFDAEGRLAGVSTRPASASDAGYALPASIFHALIDRVKATTRI
jgi:S1-C subfamily serine protease